MKKIVSMIAITILAAMIFAGCESKPDPIPVEGWESYQDPVMKFEIEYPSNWHDIKIAGESILIYSSRHAATRFRDYATTGFPSAKIYLGSASLSQDTTEMVTIDTVVSKNMIFEKSVYQGPEKVTIDGVEGRKYTYSFELEDGMFNGEMYVAAADTATATVVVFETFANTMETYRGDFDKVLNSVKLAKTPGDFAADTIYQEVEAEPPSSDLRTISGQGFSMGVPENFNKESAPSGGAEETYNFMGKRRGDSFIRIDIFDAAKTKDAQKVAQDNVPQYRGASSVKSMKIGGQDAYYFDYAPTGTIKGRVWFTIYNQKLYRIMINWFKGEESLFLPPFEKAVNSIKFK
ncbi:MAG: hypothetical protein ACLFQX_10580 [Candidatus Kapaibacterium sp.]